VILAYDWTAIASIATAGATLVLAAATFASVRSANRAARAAERSLLAGLVPLLTVARADDPPQKVGFHDGRWFHVPGGQAMIELSDEAIYLAMGVRNAGSGIAVLDGWCVRSDAEMAANDHAPLEAFTRLTRDLYIAPGEPGFWQGTFRDPAAPAFAAAREAIRGGGAVRVEILYGDQEGGQRTITQFALVPHDEENWIATVSRHWSLDRPNPR
jgi:hypothetical protein